MLDRNLTIPIPCPECKKEFEETIARLEKNPTLACPACKATFTIQADELRRGLQELEQSFAKLQRKITLNIKL